jgi:hypothetical protein
MKLIIVLLVAPLLTVAGHAAAAQTRPAPPPLTPPAAAVLVDQNARETRDRLRDILGQYPPSLALVLQLDPTLLTRQEYLAPYPTLATYLVQHPEVAHNPAYFLDLGGVGGPRRVSVLNSVNGGSESTRAQTVRELRQTMAPMFFLVGFLGTVGAFVYLARAIIDHRRWLRAVQIQTEAHTKIVDRLSTNEDLLAYLQSASGQRLLALTPSVAHAPMPGALAPISRILWSLQTGIVVAVGGFGLLIANGRLIEELAQPLYLIATVAIAVGIGFVLSAVAAFALSRHLGLLQADSTHA